MIVCSVLGGREQAGISFTVHKILDFGQQFNALYTAGEKLSPGINDG